MDSMIAKLRVALQLDSAAFESGTNRAAQEVNALGINMQAARSRMNAFSEGLIVSGGNAQRLGSQMRAVNDNAGLMRAGLQNAGFQLQDMAVQFASGQRAGTILAQQLPQLSGAIAQIAQASGQTSGVVGRLASFLGGPWGVAVGVGAAVLSPLIARLFDTGAAADDATAKLQTTAQAARNLVGAENGLALAQKQIELNKLRDRRLELENYIDRQPKNTATGQPMFSYAQQKELLAVRQQIMAQEAVVRSAEEQNQQLLDNLDKATRPILRSGGGGSPARRAGQDAGRAYRSGLEDELRKLEQTTGGLEATVFKPLADRTKEQFSFRDTNAAKILREELSDVSKVAGYTGEKITDTNKKIGESFFDMSQRAISSLQQLSNGIRSGDFLGTLSGVLGVLQSLGKFGLFGSKIKSNLLNIDGAKADGGPVSAGRMYLVGERGPELFRANSSGTIVPNHALRGADGGGNVINNYYTLPSDEFWGRVNAGHAVAAQAGGEIGYNKVQRAGARRLA